ncbi:MAG TPA: pyridoxal 5'-phosphate synthase glutaminase subunit PdxT [Oligoflexia bacterium]|nr:pyridoxal 5'-phosphate synthase glutaminase subunit PdxT [Oligoflexia bacterium]HMP47205.1 pyridoxal 5'-phosphate synthase glutaminase subunit PdxT [Oligoflexia bacterium]
MSKILPFDYQNLIQENHKIGVLSLQGDFAAHIKSLSIYKINAIQVKTIETLQEVHSLIIPGGESSTLLKLIDDPLKNAILERARNQMPILATCAGAILLAKNVENPSQESLDLIDITVRRNAYGRQLDSFIEAELEAGDNLKEFYPEISAKAGISFEGVFIRAPKILACGKNVKIILKRKNEPVLVTEKNIIAACFHPELSNQPHIAYLMLFNLIAKGFTNR